MPSIGAMISGSLFMGEFTRGLIGHAFIRSAGNVTRIYFPASRDQASLYRDVVASGSFFL